MQYITLLSIWIIPSFILLVLVIAALKRLRAYELVVEGGNEG